MFGCGKLLKQILATLQGIAVGIDDTNKRLKSIEERLDTLESKSDLHFRCARGGSNYIKALEAKEEK